MASKSTISDAIIKDHRELEQYYNEVINNPEDHDRQERWGNQFVWELARHSIAEELVVYPAMQKYMGPEGDKKAEKDRAEHHKVKEHLKIFQSLSPTSSDYIPKLRTLWTDLSSHIKEEEEDDLPSLESALSKAEKADSPIDKAISVAESPKAGKSESEILATRFESTKMFVPTRSHPSAGENPAFESVMGLLTAPIDLLGDMLRKFPGEQEKKEVMREL